MKPLHAALELIEKDLKEQPFGRHVNRKVYVDGESLQQLLNEFRKLDSRIRLDYNKERVENHQPLSSCFQCPNFHSFKQNKKTYGSCPVLGVVKELPEDKSLISVFDDLWCTFHGVDNHQSLYAVKSRKPEFTPPAQPSPYIKFQKHCDHSAINNTTGKCVVCGAIVN